MSKSFNFNVIDNDIYVTTMDASTSRQNICQCSRCKSIWHVVQDCPFAEAGTLAPGPRPSSTTARTPPATSQRQPASSANASTQVCFNWNAGRCVAPCNRRHVCERCGGWEPRPRCINCNFGAVYNGKAKSPSATPTQTTNFQQSGGNSAQQGRMG